jgi:hypothetical protein
VDERHDMRANPVLHECNSYLWEVAIWRWQTGLSHQEDRGCTAINSPWNRQSTGDISNTPGFQYQGDTGLTGCAACPAMDSKTRASVYTCLVRRTVYPTIDSIAMPTWQHARQSSVTHPKPCCRKPLCPKVFSGHLCFLPLNYEC